MRKSVLALGVMVLIGGPTALAFFSGGFFDRPRLIAGIVAAALVIVAAALAPRPLPASTPGRVALAGLSVLTAWTGLSLVWAPRGGPRTSEGTPCSGRCRRGPTRPRRLPDVLARRPCGRRRRDGCSLRARPARAGPVPRRGCRAGDRGSCGSRVEPPSYRRVLAERRDRRRRRRVGDAGRAGAAGERRGGPRRPAAAPAAAASAAPLLPTRGRPQRGDRRAPPGRHRRHRAGGQATGHLPWGDRERRAVRVDRQQSLPVLARRRRRLGGQPSDWPGIGWLPRRVA